MPERPKNKFEKEVESTPTSEEIELIFKRLVVGGTYESIRKLTDKHGLYLWDIKISEKDGHTEYSYMRAGQYPEGQASTTAIHITFFDETGIPKGGHSVAKYVGGEWK